ncbi:HTH domain-containing protein [Agrococcus sp. TSP3-2-1]|uniref:HTH domain-containing protein n=1 Tax=Agrococcus sp. TSP3-2-1 TaxID=2804583 RepID=UPI003CEED63F
MTLHEAMRLVLEAHGRPMSSREIADAVHARGLYSRRDGKAIGSRQYSDLFARSGGLLRLR